MTTRAKILQLREAQAAIGVKLERLALSTEDASVLATELKDGEARHPAALAAGVAAITAFAERPKPEGNEGLMSYFAELGKVADRFWEAFEGQIVEGVEIIRRRA